MLVRAMMVTPFLFSGAIPVFDLIAPVFSGRQLLWSGREVKRLRDNSRCRFHVGRRTRKYVVHLSSPGMTTRASNLAHGFPGSSRAEFRLSDLGAEAFRARRPFFFAAFILVPRSGTRVAFPRREALVPGGGLGRLLGAGVGVWLGVQSQVHADIQRSTCRRIDVCCLVITARTAV